MTEKNNKSEPSEVLAVKKTIKILESLAENEKMTLTDLSKKINENKSTIYRFICTLENYGYVKRNEQDDISLTLKIFQLGMCIYSHFDIVDYALPGLNRLAELTGETIHLAVNRDNQLVYLHKIESTHNLRVTMQSKVGYLAPEYCTGVGKILLAWQPKEKLDNYLSTCKFTKFTSNTICNRLDLENELKKIKKQNYCFDYEEHEEGVRCVAAPIFGLDGQVIASISISGPSVRMTDVRLKTLVPPLLECSDKISKKIIN